MQSENHPLLTKEPAKPSSGSRALAICALLLALPATFGIYHHFQNQESTFNPSASKVVEYLKALEKIADENGGSRSIVNGHSKSVDFVLSELATMNSTFKYWTQELPVTVQVNDFIPEMTLHQKGEDVPLNFRTEFGVVRGSGSGKIDKAKVVYVHTCALNVKAKNWVAAIDLTAPSEPACTPCDRLMVAIREGAKGAVFLGKSGNEQGYPFPLPPQPGRCGRQPKYIDQMKMIAIVSLNDSWARNFLRMSTGKNFRVSMELISTFREFTTRNVVAETVMGDSENIVIFGSHLDSVPAGPGVNDDGSGSMATLELARALHESDLPSKMKQKLRFAWWSAEEIGLHGSIYYVNRLSKHDPELLAKHKINIDTDMIGSPNYVRGVWDASPYPDSKMRRQSEKVAALIEKYFADKGKPTVRFPFNGRSDFAPFMEAGIPAAGVITGEDEIKTPEQAILFGGISGMVLDPCYHQDCDRVKFMQGAGMEILEENVECLKYVLHTLATMDDLDGFLGE